MILAPFTKDALIITLNIVLMIGIMFHWSVNNQTCCLTILEKFLRGAELDAETFFGNLVGPVYSANEHWISWVFILTLFIFNLFSLYKNKNDVKSKWEQMRALMHHRKQ